MKELFAALCVARKTGDYADADRLRGIIEGRLDARLAYRPNGRITVSRGDVPLGYYDEVRDTLLLRGLGEP
jgi:hypothetical protein